MTGGSGCTGGRAHGSRVAASVAEGRPQWPCAPPAGGRHAAHPARVGRALSACHTSAGKAAACPAPRPAPRPCQQWGRSRPPALPMVEEKPNDWRTAGGRPGCGQELTHGFRNPRTSGVCWTRSPHGWRGTATLCRKSCPPPEPPAGRRTSGTPENTGTAPGSLPGGCAGCGTQSEGAVSVSALAGGGVERGRPWVRISAPHLAGAVTWGRSSSPSLCLEPLFAPDKGSTCLPGCVRTKHQLGAGRCTQDSEAHRGPWPAGRNHSGSSACRRGPQEAGHVWQASPEGSLGDYRHSRYVRHRPT